MEVRAGARMTTLLIFVSCSTAPTNKEQEEGFRLGDPNVESDGGNYGSVAHAATSDAAIDAAPEVAMPLNPSHISIRFPKVPEVKVNLLSGQPCPYPYTITVEEDATVVTLYLPQGVAMGIKARPVMQAGLSSEGEPIYEAVGPEVNFTIEPEAKLGTNELPFGGSHTTINFSSGAQNPLKMGENVLHGPVTQEFIDGQMRSVIQGLYEAKNDQICHISWAGTEKIYSFLDDFPACRAEPFDIQLKAGQQLGIYSVVGPETEAVNILLEP